MSSGVSLRPSRPRRVLVADAEEVVAWLSMLAVSHGLETDGEDGQWLLTCDDLSIEVVLDTRRSGVREVEVVPHLFFADEDQERSVKGVWREILGELLAFAGRAGGVLRSSDGDTRLDVGDLDAEAGLDRVDYRPDREEREPDPRWAWSPVAAHPTPPDPMPAALVAVDPERGLGCDESAVRGWLAEREDAYHDRVADLEGGWRLSCSTLLDVDLVAIRNAGRLVRLDLVGTPSYSSVQVELGARREYRIFLDDLAEFGRGVGGVVAVGDPPRVVDDDGLYGFVGMTRMARRRFIMPAGVKPLVDFAALTPARAQELMDQWLAEEPARLGWLAERCAGEVDLDRSPESLVRLWRWVRPALEWRTQVEGFDPDRLPVWIDLPGMGVDQFSDDTLWLVDAVARYWAVVWCEVTGDRWVLHRSRIRGDGDRNRPVLERYRGSPITPVLVSADRSLSNQPLASDDQLRTLLDQARS